MQPPAGQLIELVSVMTVAVPIMVKIAPITMKANPRVWNECLHAGTGVILSLSWRVESKWFKFV